jgi:hypothetical protein
MRSPAIPTAGSKGAVGLYWLGLLFFLCAKLALVGLPPLAMGLPRLGDDALAHLWRGALLEEVGPGAALTGDLTKLPPLVGDVRATCGGFKVTPKTDSEKWCRRILSRIGDPILLSAAHVPIAFLTDLPISSKWQYFIFDMAVALVLALGLGALMRRLVGPGAAGLGLILLGPLMLPGQQGLHQFVPSTLTIGLSAWIWSIALKDLKFGVHFGWCLLGSVLLALVHPVALVFAAGLALIALFANYRAFLTFRWALLGGVLLALVIVLVFVSELLRLTLEISLQSSFWSNVRGNLAGAHEFGMSLMSRNALAYGLILLALLGTRWWKDQRLRATILSLVGMLLLSLLHSTAPDFFFFPMDLFSRIFTLFGAVGCALVGLMLWRMIGLPLGRRYSVSRFVAPTLAIVVLGTATALSIPSLIQNARQNVNHRRALIDEAHLHESLEALPADSILVFEESDVTIPEVLLNGGGRFHGIALQTLSDDAGQAALRRPGATVVLPLFEDLNQLAALNKRDFSPRIHGMDGRYTDQLIIKAARDNTLPLYLRIRNRADDKVPLDEVTITDTGGKARPLAVPPVNARTDDWVEIDAGDQPQATEWMISLPKKLIVTGVALGQPSDNLRWPWNQGVEISWHRRGAPPDEGVVRLDLSVAGLLRANGASSQLAEAAPTDFAVVSDWSGFLIARVMASN